MDSRVLAAASAGAGARSTQQVRPARLGAMPPLADCFSARPETGLASLRPLSPGQPAVLTAAESTAGLHDWPGGTGRTQLAAFLAESAWQARETEVLIWVIATGRAPVLAGYAQAYGAMMGADHAGGAETAAARLLGWLGQTRQPWLVVLQDLAGAADLAGLWPEGPAGRVLITTPGPIALPGTAEPLVFPVGAFSSHEALTYLMARLSTDPDQRMGAVDLLEELDREPLALAQASATIASSELSCRDYRELFARRRNAIAETAGAMPSAKAVTWTLSVEQADQLSPGGLAQPCLALAALLDGHGIPGAVFTTQAACEYITAHGGAPDRKRVHTTLAQLERTGLLTIDNTSSARTVRVHPAVQAAVRSAAPESMLQAAGRVAASALVQAWPAGGEQPALADALRSCAASLQQAVGQALWAGGSHAVLFRTGQSLDGERLTGPAVAHWRSLAGASERHLGAGHPDTVVAWDRLARASLAAGLGPEAVSLYQRMLNTRESTLGPDHPSLVTARADLGKALLKAGRAPEAISVLEGILSIRDRIGAPAGLDLLAVQDTLTTAYAEAGRYPDAIRLGRRTLAERERRQGAGHLDTLATRRMLASACLAAGRPKDAIEHCKRALADAERVLGADHPDTIGAVSALASAYHAARKLAATLPLYERALRDRERVLGPDHPDTIGTRGNLASAYHSAGRMASALELYQRCRTDCRRVLGPQHPDTLAAHANLAHAYFALGRLTEATALLKDTLAECERALPPGDPLTTAVRDSLDAVARG